MRQFIIYKKKPRETGVFLLLIDEIDGMTSH